MMAEAFSPGHITGFFEVCDHRNILRKGSRGAGLCLSRGVRSEVEATPARRPGVEVHTVPRVPAPLVVELAVRALLGNRRYHVRVDSRIELPVGQGFGMSAAGALSAALATASCLRKRRAEAYYAAHSAEILSMGGLGDVAALSRGGVTMRTRAGVPPFGRVERIPGEGEVVLCCVGRPLRTKTVLQDPALVARLSREGAAALESLQRRPTLRRLMAISREFAERSGLLTKPVEVALQVADRFGAASVAMLGHSVFAFGETAQLQAALRPFGQVEVCEIDLEGPRLL